METKRLVEVERQMRWMRSLVGEVLEKQTHFRKEHEELNRRCEECERVMGVLRLIHTHLFCISAVSVQCQ